MRKVAAWFFIVLGTGLMGVSTSKILMRAVSDRRHALQGPFGVHHAPTGGDLVTMAYLDDYSKFCEPYGYRFKRPVDTGSRNIDLYVWGDSYVMEVPDSAYAHIDRYRFGRRDYTDLHYILDPRKRNILVIENGERFTRLFFKYLSIFDQVKKEAAPAALVRYAGFGLQPLFNPAVNENLEFNLFSYNCMAPVRRWKADLTYGWFDRASGDVTVSENGQYLFLGQTVAPHGPLSCYEPIEAGELSNILTNTDSIYLHYRREGFDEVYFSLIPNPASILQPAHYNGLIDSFQHYAASRGIPVIDVYGPFSKSPDPSGLYRTGDTHWNDKGLQLWLTLVNRELARQSAR